MNKVFVSCIMPAYNAEKYIYQSIESVIAQTYKNWELIVIDDGSTDNTADIIRQFQNRDKRIHYYFQTNAKQAAARNNAINRANGEILAFLDSDDQWTINHIEICLAELNKNTCDIVSTGFYDSFVHGDMQLDNNRSIHPIYSGIYSGDEGLNLFIMSNKVATSSVLMRKTDIKKIGLFDPKATPAEDYDLWIRAIKIGIKVKVLPEATMYYRHHEKSSTSNNKPRWSFNEDFDVLNKNFTIRQLQSLPFEVEKSLALKFKYWVRFSSESFILRKKIFYLVKFAGRTLDIELLILFILRFLKLIQHNKLNTSITSRINIFYLSE